MLHFMKLCSVFCVCLLLFQSFGKERAVDERFKLSAMVYIKSKHCNRCCVVNVLFWLAVSAYEGVKYEFSKSSFIAYFYRLNFYFTYSG